MSGRQHANQKHMYEEKVKGKGQEGMKAKGRDRREGKEEEGRVGEEKELAIEGTDGRKEGWRVRWKGRRRR